MKALHCLDPFPDGSPVVLLLHGLGANSSMWSLQFDALHAAGFRPLAPDMPGFGDSKYDGHGWSFRRVAAELADLVVELHSGPVHVIGLSMGGVIAQQFALDFPQLINKLVLVSTFSVLRPSSLSQWFYFVQRAVVVHTVGLSAQSKIVAQRVFPGPGQEALRDMAEKQIASADPRAYRAAMRSLGLYNSRQRLKEIKASTLVISGANDSTVSPLYQRALADGIPCARQVIIQDAGHAVAIDQFETFNSILVGFLQDSPLMIL
jgi:3-oxoadipate enol-lactonase